MTYKIVGIKSNGEKEDVADGYPSLGWCYATATKRAIDIRVGGNPVISLGLKSGIQMKC